MAILNDANLAADLGYLERCLDVLVERCEERADHARTKGATEVAKADRWMAHKLRAAAVLVQICREEI
jgi:hypothetical protein